MQCVVVDSKTPIVPAMAWLLLSCRHLAARTNVDLRRTCASCVSDLMAAPLPGSSPSYLYDTWTDLAADHDEQVQRLCTYMVHVLHGSLIVVHEECLVLQQTSAGNTCQPRIAFLLPNWSMS